MGIAPGTTAIGTITRLMPSKGNQYLIDAAPQILAAHPEARLFVVGEGELQAPLQEQARALGLGDRLVFSGFMRDVAAALSALDIVVFPSLWEGTPLTVFEALAMGKPIVATDADGLLDVLTDRQDALIVPKADAAALAAAVISLLERPAVAAGLVDRGARDRAAVRHCRLRPKDGAALRTAARNLARDRTGGYPEGRTSASWPPRDDDRHRSPDRRDARHHVAARLEMRSLTWRLGASVHRGDRHPADGVGAVGGFRQGLGRLRG